MSAGGDAAALARGAEGGLQEVHLAAQDPLQGPREQHIALRTREEERAVET